MKLNEEQTLAVEHVIGEPACLIAGAGSGKTRVLTERVRWLIDVQHVAPRRICAITFTNKAAGELIERLGISAEMPVQTIPRVSTIHSLALNAIRKSPLAFGLESKVTPLDDYDQKQMMKKLIEREKIENENQYHVLELIGFHRARGVGFADEYTDEIHKEALAAHGGYHALEPHHRHLWKLFEEEKRKNSVVDFDDMLHLVVRRMRRDPEWLSGIQRQFEHVLMDEAQDTNPVQWEFVNGLLGPENRNLYVVGDMSQCQPPWSKIKIVMAPPRGGRPAVCEQRPISEIRNGDLAVAWSKHVQISYSAGRKMRVASRFYSGPMLKIETSMGSTDCTPNHWNWVRFNNNAVGKYAVYLMYRSDLGYRVGIAALKRSTGKGKNRAYGLSTRFNQEKAEKAWIVRVCNSRPEAEAWEEVYSVKYGIPESLFEPSPCINKTAELIKLVFQHANPEGGLHCLVDHGLLVDYPLLANRTEGFRGASWRGYFKTAAANILPNLMDIPIEGRNKSTGITGLSSFHYEGLVYSLDVEKDHTYIADGLVVGNSIYGFNGAVPRILKEYSENWRGIVPKLYRIARNHRSVPEIVKLANLIQSKMTDTIPLRMESWRGVNDQHGETRLLKGCLPTDVACSIAYEIARDNERFIRNAGLVAVGSKARNYDTPPMPYKDNCILVRASIQIRDIETELVKQRIPYVVRGGRGLLQTEEVRDVMSYLRLASNHKDFMALVRCAMTPKRGVGEVALERIRKKANDQYDGDLIEACRYETKPASLANFVDIIDHVTRFKDAPVNALKQILFLTNYEAYVKQKYHREQDKVKAKLENIQRFTLMIDGLTEGSEMTTEDIIFQLTLDRPRDDDEQGSVTISTIHSAKGLEWRRVYVSNVTEGSLPHKFSMGSEEEVEEERRLFYVACTRPKDTLVVCINSMVQNQQNTQRVEPSRFLQEIGIN